MSEPQLGRIEPDTKDWTWVLQRRCPECGMAAGAIVAAEVPDLLRGYAERWAEVLRRPDVAAPPPSAPRTRAAGPAPPPQRWRPPPCRIRGRGAAAPRSSPWCPARSGPAAVRSSADPSEWARHGPFASTRSSGRRTGRAAGDNGQVPKIIGASLLGHRHVSRRRLLAPRPLRRPDDRVLANGP